MKHKGTVTIETERIILRKFFAEDVQAAFRNWTNDEKVTEFLRWQVHRNLAVTERVVNDWMNHYKNSDYYQWAIVPKSVNEPIGTISVTDLDEKTGKVHIGYCIGSKWWHSGFTSEAFSAIISFFFEEVEAERIESMHDPENPNSGKVMKKCGLIYEGTLRKSDWSNRGIVDACVYSILASDYFKNGETDS